MEALSIAISQEWLGNDGPWSPFSIGYGTPPQFVSSLISSSAPQPYVIIPGGCIPSDPINCPATRGELFYANRSSTWQNLGNYELISEQNLNINDAGDFGFDNMTLGMSGSGAPSIGHQIVVGIVAKDYFLASWGLRPAPTNFSNFNTPIPSVLQSLKAVGDISSLSWGYTAGSYQLSQVNKFSYGSLTIGGYDKARFEANNASFVMAPDISRDLVVGLISIQTANALDSLLPEPILTFLDSGVSHIWLPEEACQRFENAFNLTYNAELDLYIVNDTVHKALLEQNATIAFTLSNSVEISTTSTPVTIHLPYSSFDLQLTNEYPGNNGTTNYFPIRRATNSSQYTLGRAFFQSAYVIADYERSTFSVHNARFPSDGSQDLQTMSPVEASSHVGISTAAIVGIVVGALVLIASQLIIAYAIRRRRRARHIPGQYGPRLGGNKGKFELHEDIKSTSELGSGNSQLHQELVASEVAIEMDPENHPRYEMQG